MGLQNGCRPPERDFSGLYYLNPDGIVIVSRSGVVRDANASALALLRMTREALVGSSARDFLTGRDLEQALQLLRRANTVPSARIEVLAALPKGAEGVFELSVLATQGGDDDAFIIFRDVTEQARARRGLAEQVRHTRRLTRYDQLTGLPNRVTIVENIRDAVLELQSAALILVELDRFRDINNTVGYAMGDLILQIIAKRLVDVVGEHATVARIGGDEFGVLLPGVKAAQAKDAALAIMAAVAQPYVIHGAEHFLTASTGLAAYPEHARDDQALSQRAAVARHQAKARGGNTCVVYEESLEQPMRTRATLERQLRSALQNEEFVLHFQPIFEAASRRLCGVEALVRWDDPVAGLTVPRDFIPIAESTGLIVPLDEWILENALQQMRDRCMRDEAFSLSVNVSAAHFFRPELPETVSGALGRHGVKSESLQIEITETMAMVDVDRSAKVVQALKDVGVCVALDDFGTGHSSLVYLQRFRLDTIKIDQSFVSRIGRSTADDAIVQSIILLSHRLGLKCTAEGVETEEQLAFLEQNGCGRVQGFLLGRPMPAQDLEQFV